MKQKRTLCAVAGLVAGGVALGYLAGFGPLDPPDGPVAETSPSLADLEAQIAAIPLGVGGTGLPADAFEARVVRDPTLPQGAIVEVLTGPVFLRSVIVRSGRIEVLDGQNQDIAFLSAPAILPDQSGLTATAQFDLNLVIDDAVRIRRSSNSGTNVTLIYAPLSGD